MKNLSLKNFNPLIFLMSLGAGGISVIPFAFFQYTFEHGKGLVNISQIGHGTLSFWQEALFIGMEGIMIIFTIIHLILSFILFAKLFKWAGSHNYKELLSDPLRNSAILAPFISIIMTMNVFIGPVRFFFVPMAQNLQSFMLPALIFWALLWVLLLRMVIGLLKTSFEKSFDVNKISFGWLLYPFALGMLTVTGTGIAALGKDPTIAHIAAFMSLVSGTMGVFLLVVKLISIFKSHFAATGLPAKQFMPSFLIVIPNITLFAISAFRLGHYMENQLGFHMGPFFVMVMTTAFAFETWYFLFGLALLGSYFKKDFFKKEFYITQWGFVCPVVAYAVLGSFVYKVFVPAIVLYGTIIVTTVIAVILFATLLIRQAKWSGIMKAGDMQCL
ncbi:hypothetical protein K9M79_04170 [Candidatus Woesearchaeota archaeon]|nr:hypothetical protein [Candidatus Woesearchaeota archaeon]